jgi:hypothetical protein
MHLTKQWDNYSPPCVVDATLTITPITDQHDGVQPACRWLGVWFDRKLNFKRHVETRAATARKVAYHIRSLANTVHGPPASALRLAIRAHTSQDSNPFARAILERRGDSLLLPKLPGKDAFRAPGDAHKEAFFIHIVHILRLNLVLPHFVMQQSEVGLVLFFAVSFMAISVHPGSPSARKEGLVPVQKSGNPRVGAWLPSNITAKISYRGSRRR